jgi:uncharacterized protein (DUF697 family)
VERVGISGGVIWVAGIGRIIVDITEQFVNKVMSVVNGKINSTRVETTSLLGV